VAGANIEQDVDLNGPRGVGFIDVKGKLHAMGTDSVRQFMSKQAEFVVSMHMPPNLMGQPDRRDLGSLRVVCTCLSVRTRTCWAGGVLCMYMPVSCTCRGSCCPGGVMFGGPVCNTTVVQLGCEENVVDRQIRRICTSNMDQQFPFPACQGE
jgi:hypothetical protein